MSDDLDRLKAALQAGTPAADPAARAAALARAMENFDAHQGKAERLRSSKDRPKGLGGFAGVRRMFERMTSKAGLAATASVAVLATGVFLVGGQQPRVMQPGDARQSAASAPEMVDGVGAASGTLSLSTEGEAAAQADMATSDEIRMAPIVPAPMFEPSDMGGAPMLKSRRMQSPSVLEPAADRFADYTPSALQVTAEAPVSTFSVDVDTASWPWIRSSLRAGVMPDPASVRVEEMVNYFPWDYAPPKDAPFATHVSVFGTPWNAGTQLVRIGLQGKAVEARPPLNLVFLVDTSGSMEGPERIGLLKSAFAMLLETLRPEDRVAIASYAGSAGEVLAPTAASDKGAILAALDRLEAGGSTAGGEGLELAYRMAEGMAREGAIGRVVLATDGDFNVGPSDPEALKALVAGKRDTGVYLSVLGFGRGNLDDALMQALAQNGNGQAAYIDSAEEARKVLVDQAAGALFPIADDVKIQVEWNPAVVAEYRLIGYETRALAREDFANDRVDAGEIGAGHQVTALYEITPVGSAARMTEPLRYGAGDAAGVTDEAGWLRLRYKAPGADVSSLIEAAIPVSVGTADADARFAAAVAGFGQLLTGGKYLGGWGYDEAVALADGARGADPFGYRAEAVRLMRVAQSLAR